MEAFDSDVLIYAAKQDPRGDSVARLLAQEESIATSMGSVVLVPELLSLPIRQQRDEERRLLQHLLTRIDLKPVDHETADLAAELGAKYALRAADSIHLATAVIWGADRFHTNNRKDFGQPIDEIEIVFP
jgi:predicted nucleic acid-binding protein